MKQIKSSPSQLKPMLINFLSEQWRMPLLFALVVAMSGCGKKDGLMSIDGTVAFDSNPLEEGMIMFVPDDGSGVMSDAKIVSGHFKARVQPQKRLAVKIYSMKVVPVHAGAAAQLTPSGERIDTRTICIIPLCYNEQTTLAIEPTTDTKTFHFDLQSEPSNQPLKK